MLHISFFVVDASWMSPWTLTALRNIEFASFLRWYVAVELHDPAYAKRFYYTYELLEENMMKVWFVVFLSIIICGVYFAQIIQMWIHVSLFHYQDTQFVSPLCFNIICINSFL